MRLGWMTFFGSGFVVCCLSLVGNATQNTSVFAIGRALKPVPITSRMQPPAPVAAPPYGSMALGWLCVSTLMHTPCSSSRAMTPELSLKTLSVQSTPSLINSYVAAATVLLSRLSISTVPSGRIVCPGLADQLMAAARDSPPLCPLLSSRYLTLLL